MNKELREISANVLGTLTCYLKKTEEYILKEANLKEGAPYPVLTGTIEEAETGNMIHFSAVSDFDEEAKKEEINGYMTVLECLRRALCNPAIAAGEKQEAQKAIAFISPKVTGYWKSFSDENEYYVSAKTGAVYECYKFSAFAKNRSNTPFMAVIKTFEKEGDINSYGGEYGVIDFVEWFFCDSDDIPKSKVESIVADYEKGVR